MASRLSKTFCYHKCYVNLGYHSSLSYFFSKVEYNCLNIITLDNVLFMEGE